MFEVTLIVQILVVTTVINASAFAVSWRRRDSTGGRAFALGMLGATCWTAAAALDYGAVALEHKIFFAKLEYTASYLALTFFTLFALAFAGHEHWFEGRWRRAALFLPAAAAISLAWTNGLHGWLWSGFRPGSVGANTVVFERGPAYGWMLVAGYGLVGVICSNLLQVALQGSEVARRQARLILAATLVPITGNLAYQLQDAALRGIDWSSITFSLTGVLTLAALYGTGFLDLAPVARDQLVHSLVDGLVVLDPKQRVVEVNEPALAMLRRTSPEVLGRRLSDIAPETGVVLGGSASEDGHAELRFASSGVHVDARVASLERGRGKPIGRLLVLRDISERIRAEQAMLEVNWRLESQLEEIERLRDALQEQAIRDPLTGLHNRRFFDEVLDRELHAAERAGTSLCLLMIDIDRFKEVNDSLGHAAGDQCLVQLAARLRERTRAADFACRYGGEEFLVLLTSAGLDDAVRVAEDLRRLVADRPVEIASGRVPLTTSIGVCCFPTHAESSADLLERADRALYRAKDQGRNRVAVWSSERETSEGNDPGPVEVVAPEGRRG